MRAILALVLSLGASVGHAEETWLCKPWVATRDGSTYDEPFLMTGTPKRYTWVNELNLQQVIELVTPKRADYDIYIGGSFPQKAYYLVREERKLTMRMFPDGLCYFETTCRLQN